MTRAHRFPRRLARRAQRGISLIFALMALVILGLAAVALTRSVDTSTLIMGNLGFKHDAVVASSAGAEQAMAWLEGKVADPTALDADLPANGYYANSLPSLDPAGNRSSAANQLALVNWDGNCMGRAAGTYTTCTTLPANGSSINGNQVQWVITRLCSGPGPSAGTNYCIRPGSSSSGEAKDKGELQPDGRFKNSIARPDYRSIVRVVGPRNTVSFTETLVHF